MIVHELTADDVVAEREIRRYPPLDYLDVVIAWDQVGAWRVTCKCGWTGGEQPAVTETKYGTRNCPEDFEDRVFAPEWSAHVAPFAALTDLEQLVDQLRDVETRIADTVLLARRRRVLGTSRPRGRTVQARRPTAMEPPRTRHQRHR